jgi:hypothetical protein
MITNNYTFVKPFRLYLNTPIVTLSIQDNDINFIIDTGSDQSIFDKELMPLFFPDTKIFQEEIICDYNETDSDSDNSITLIDSAVISFTEGITITGKFTLLNCCEELFYRFSHNCNLLVSGTIATDMLDKYEMIIDYKRKLLYSKQ